VLFNETDKVIVWHGFSNGHAAHGAYATLTTVCDASGVSVSAQVRRCRSDWLGIWHEMNLMLDAPRAYNKLHRMKNSLLRGLERKYSKITTTILVIAIAKAVFKSLLIEFWISITKPSRAPHPPLPDSSKSVQHTKVVAIFLAFAIPIIIPFLIHSRHYDYSNWFISLIKFISDATSIGLGSYYGFTSLRRKIQPNLPVKTLNDSQLHSKEWRDFLLGTVALFAGILSISLAGFHF
jgi:hypothetical protein